MIRQALVGLAMMVLAGLLLWVVAATIDTHVNERLRCPIVAGATCE